jgi:glycosyltransferase involved in cell wall biosynthesis
MDKLSIVIITHNEEKNIDRCLQSVQAIADEIVVVDSYSTDKTEEICRNFNVKFIRHDFEGHIQQKNWARNQSEYDFVLSLDADEVLSSELIGEIKKIKNVRRYDGYSFNRLTNYCGKWVKHTGWYPDTKLRLWDRTKGEWRGKNPHDRFEMQKNCTLSHIKGDILHYSYHTMGQHLNQIAKFSEISAYENYKKGRKINMILLLFRPLFIFFKKYFIKLGILDGYYGFVISMLTAYGIFQKDILLRELTKKKP